MIEPPPRTSVPVSGFNESDRELIAECNSRYLYWDKVKYRNVPSGIDNEAFWTMLKAIRRSSSQMIRIGKDCFTMFITPEIAETLHMIDHTLSRMVPSEKKQQFITSTLMEEAIASSNIEGASTTREEAKKMLRSRSVPDTRGAMMILNNYRTIEFLSGHSNDSLTPESLCDIHRMITTGTLDNPDDSGRIRTDDSIHVMDMLSGEVIYTPPSSSMLEEKIRAFCGFFSQKNNDPFLHPVLKAMIIHFYLAYLHPFADGNGRTARSLFYWYMLKAGYPDIAFLSISRIIYKHKASYEKAFLCTELDDNDLTYFIMNQCRVLKASVGEMVKYIKRKEAERDEAISLIGAEKLNERQARLLTKLSAAESQYITVEEYRSMNAISTQTARTDLRKLAELGYLREFPINERKSGFRPAKRV